MFSRIWAMVLYSSGCDMIFAEVSFRVRFGALQARSFRKLRVDPYRRTPPSIHLKLQQTGDEHVGSPDRYRLQGV